MKMQSKRTKSVSNNDRILSFRMQRAENSGEVSKIIPINKSLKWSKWKKYNYDQLSVEQYETHLGQVVW